MKNVKRIIPIVLAIVLVLGSSAFAAVQQPNEVTNVGTPSLKVIGTTAVCECRISFGGQAIDATMELYQGSTLVASWSDTGTGSVYFYETETIVHGLTYTLTVSGTVDGISFTPRSITKTL